MTVRRVFLWGCCALVLLGVFLRFFCLRESGFFFYDEAFYLHHNLPVLEFIQQHHFQTWSDKLTAAYYYFRSALGSGKSLWFFLMDSRFFWGGLHDWMFPKVLAACFGVLILPLAYLFARRYYECRNTAILATALMAVLPGLVFYSRIGLQESLSTCLVLAGFYLYLFYPRLGWRTVAAGIVLSAAFFANYRLIMLPFLVLCLELWEGVVLQKGVQFRKFLWFGLSFFACVVLVGNLLDGANTTVIFAWVFHQEEMAGGSFAWINLLSHPFYLFLMETALFAMVFFAGAVFAFWKDRAYALPAVLVMVQMIVFSLTSEKGARYLCVMLPFAVMSAAHFLGVVSHRISAQQRRVFYGAVLLMLGLMVLKSWQLVTARSDYAPAIRLMDRIAPGAKILSSQDQVQSLYVLPEKRVRPVPARFDRLLPLYHQGYRYLILDPQAYVGLTGGVRFKPELADYLGFIDGHMTPVKTFPHMNHAMLERFVCEHSENLAVSIRFLYAKDVDRMASIRIYDITEVVPRMSALYMKYLKERKQ
jgi:hypothetical protein